MTMEGHRWRPAQTQVPDPSRVLFLSRPVERFEKKKRYRTEKLGAVKRSLKWSGSIFGVLITTGRTHSAISTIHGPRASVGPTFHSHFRTIQCQSTVRARGQGYRSPRKWRLARDRPKATGSNQDVHTS